MLKRKEFPILLKPTPSDLNIVHQNYLKKEIGHHQSHLKKLIKKLLCYIVLE